MPRNGLKAWSWKKGPKKTLKSPMNLLRVKWWGPKHLESSYFCELSLPTKFQTSKTSPSFKFWWGNSCCCSCDRGKTKSTPSLGFRLRLEFDNNWVNMCTVSCSALSIWDNIRQLLTQMKRQNQNICLLLPSLATTGSVWTWLAQWPPFTGCISWRYGFCLKSARFLIVCHSH